MSKRLTIDLQITDPEVRSTVCNVIGDQFNVLDPSTDEIKPGEADILLVDPVVMNQFAFEKKEDSNNSDELHAPVICIYDENNREHTSRVMSHNVDEVIPLGEITDELITRLETFKKYINKIKVLQDGFDSSQRIAFDTMAGMNELSQVMKLVERSYVLNTYDQLGEQILAGLQSLSLNCVVVFYPSNEFYAYSSNGEVKPIELDVINQTREAEGRFHDFGRRTVINYKYISLLVKNLPVDDSMRYGRIRDILPIMLGTFDARVKTMDTENYIRNQAQELTASLEIINSGFSYLNELLQENLSKGNTTMWSMLNELNDHLPSMGLEDDQERYILERIEHAIDDSMSMVDVGDELEHIFNNVKVSMSRLVEKQDKLMFSMLNAQQENKEEAENTSADDIELF